MVPHHVVTLFFDSKLCSCWHSPVRVSRRMVALLQVVHFLTQDYEVLGRRAPRLLRGYLHESTFQARQDAELHLQVAEHYLDLHL